MPSLHFPAQQNYDCVQCGRSCQAGWDIAVEEPIRQKLEGQPLTLRVIQEHGAALVEKKSGWVLNMTPRCGFLEDDLLCGIHRHLGVEAKPNTCRLFPFILSQTPDGTYVGVSYSCTAARQNSGRSLAEHGVDIAQLMAVGTTTNVIHDDGLVVHGSWFTSWQEYRQFESRLGARAAQSNWQTALAEALCGLAQQVASWGKPRTSSPRPAPQELATGVSVNEEALTAMRQEMWSQLSEHLLPELAGVEPALRQHYQSVTQSLTGLESVPALPEVERYLEHLVFRKQLVMHPTLLSNLCLAHFLPTFLGLYAQGFAKHRQRPLADQDYWDALDLAEKFLVYHCRGLRPVYQRCARFLVEHMRRPA
ncbi:YkgJ family cysteine cluster protein [bacterium]|nr:YkgJ family cysteine cluster protein [bacterium]